MSEEIKKEVQDVELNPEDIEKVSGGKIGTTPKCPNCGEYLDWDGGFGTYIAPNAAITSRLLSSTVHSGNNLDDSTAIRGIAYEQSI